MGNSSGLPVQSGGVSIKLSIARRILNERSSFIDHEMPKVRCRESPTKNVGSAPEVTKRQNARKYIPVSVRRDVFQKDKSCQWKDPKTQKICGSRFQAQIDHRHPLYLGGGNERGNLQVLCAAHNRHKYRRERSEDHWGRVDGSQ